MASSLATGTGMKAALCTLVVVLLMASFNFSAQPPPRTVDTPAPEIDAAAATEAPLTSTAQVPRCPTRVAYIPPDYTRLDPATITLPSPTVAARAIAWALGDVSSTRSVIVVVSLGHGFTFAASRGQPDAKLPRSVLDAAAGEARGSVTVLWNRGASPYCKGGATARLLADSFIRDAYSVRSVKWAVRETEHCTTDNGTAVKTGDPRTFIVGSDDPLVHNTFDVVTAVDDGATANQREEDDPFPALRHIAEELSRNTVGVIAIMSTGRGKAPLVWMTTDRPRLHDGILIHLRRGVSAFQRVGQMVVVWGEDESCFCPHSAWNAAAKALMARYADRLRIATMNPCIVNATTGAIGVGEITVPPFDVYRSEQELDALWTRGFTPFRDRPAVVRWRGVTTGIPWKESQRYKALLRFAEIGNATGAPEGTFDVGASGIVQNVVPEDIPLQRPGMSELDMGLAQVVLDLDGNANAWRGGHWKHFAGAAVLRVQGPYVLWYYRHLVNGTHVLWYDTAEEMADAAAALVRQPQSNATLALLERVAVGSQTFALAHLTVESLVEETEQSVRCAFQGGEGAHTVDWRMKRTLTPLLTGSRR